MARNSNLFLCFSFWLTVTSPQLGVSTVHVRLVDNDVPNAGRVEVGYKDVWKSLSDTQWNIKNAHVICRMLGYNQGATAAIKGMLGSGDCWLSTIYCKGYETTIDNCKIRNRKKKPCENDTLAGVVCNSALDPNISVRLVDGIAPNQGRVEVRYYGIWGTVCDDHWGLEDGNVVCRMLNYSKASWAGVVKVQGRGPILLDELRCQGKESSIDYCRLIHWGRHDCRHHEDANVTCENETRNELVTARLLGSNQNHTGSVEVNYNGTWKPVCDDKWDISDAHVICRMLGYKAALAAMKGFNVGKTGLWMGGVGCNGGEESISECFHEGWSNKQCKGIGTAGVICKLDEDQRPNVAVRLVNGTTPNQGRVEVRYYGVWGTVCGARAWGLRDAHVICRMLNYSKASWVGTAEAKGSGPILLDNLICRGNERSIEHCPDIRWSRNDCRHFSDAGVRCETSTHDQERTVTVRLDDGLENHVGRVEVNYNGTWIPVCGDTWSILEAHVICRMLGYKAALAGMKQYGAARDIKVWMSKMVCSGDEDSISQCSRLEWSNTKCPSNYYAGVICSKNEDPPPVQVRLEDGSSPSSGRVAVRYGNLWGTICNMGLDINDAKVICRMLGYPGASNTYSFDAFAKPFDLIWLSDLKCNGTEKSIVDCRHPGWGEIKTCNLNDVGVACKPAQAPLFQIKRSNAITNCTVEIVFKAKQPIDAQLKSFYQVAVEKRDNEQRYNSYDPPLPFVYNEVNVTMATEMGNDSYITAEILSPISNFTIGDSQYYHGYYNAPLEPGSMYRVHVRIVTMAMDGTRTYGNSTSVTFTTKSWQTSRDTSGMDMGISDGSHVFVIAISVVLGALLLTLLLLIIYIFVRSSLRKRKGKKDLETEMQNLKNSYNLL